LHGEIIGRTICRTLDDPLECEETDGMHAQQRSSGTLEVPYGFSDSDGSDSVHVEFAILVRSG